ncbi:MAG: hypothetical protein RL023_217 [Candidatus Parcubacteria bacterium]|jgi:GTP-binding protein
MRREGWELQVGAPEVISKVVDGVKMEPIEQLIINVDESLAGSIIENISNRKGMMTNLNTLNGLTTIEFEVPTRGLL